MRSLLGTKAAETAVGALSTLAASAAVSAWGSCGAFRLSGSPLRRQRPRAWRGWRGAWTGSRATTWSPPNLEFPSVAYNWRNVREQGVELRLVPHRDWLVREEDLLAAVDERTRVLAVSQVSFYTGQNLDVEQLADGLAGSDALLAVDATHAAGAVAVPAACTDLCVSSCYKWLLATHGVAPCYLSQRAEAQVRSTAFGWRNLAVWPAQGAVRAPDADEKPMPDKMEPGNPAMVAVLYLDYALGRLLDVGIERIEEHNRDLSEQISAGLERLGRQVISPSERSQRSGNTCFADDDAHGLCEALADRGVLVWGGIRAGAGLGALV